MAAAGMFQATGIPLHFDDEPSFSDWNEEPMFDCNSIFSFFFSFQVLHFCVNEWILFFFFYVSDDYSTDGPSNSGCCNLDKTTMFFLHLLENFCR